MLLVAVDIAGCAWMVVAEASKLAADLGASVRLMTSVEVPAGLSPHAHLSGPNEGKTPLEVIKEDAHSELDALASVFRDAGVAVDLEVRVGTPVEAVLLSAQECVPRMLVLGTHARQGWKRMVMGSVAENILRRCNRPVFVVPGGEVIPHPTAVQRAMRFETDG